MNQDKTPKVSVVMIFLNEEKFIQEAIESVISQTYSNWELILVDDGSSDRSTGMAQKYANQFSNKIHYIDHSNHQNFGMSASRNIGAKKADGKYLVNMDADDVLLPHKLERQVAILEANPEVTMVYAPSLYWYGWTEKKEDIARDQTDKIGVVPGKVYYPPQLMTVFLSGKSNGPCSGGVMLRRNILESIGGWEDDFRNLFEHQVFMAKIVLNYPVYVEGAPVDKYRQHPDMSSIQPTDRQAYKAAMIYIQWLSQYIIQNNINDADLNTALKKVFSFRKTKTIIKNILPSWMFRYLNKFRKPQ